MSARPQFTITLGRSGQVVKRTGSMSDASHSDFESSSGSKRPIRERLGNNVSDPLSYDSLSKNKRQRTEDRSWSQSADGLEDNKQYMPVRRTTNCSWPAPFVGSREICDHFSGRGGRHDSIEANGRQ